MMTIIHQKVIIQLKKMKYSMKEEIDKILD